MANSYGTGGYGGYANFYNSYSQFGGASANSGAYGPALTSGSYGGGSYIDPNISEVTYDTSSKDPLMMRSRCFIGNLQRVTVQREEIIKLFMRFGRVTACAFFQEKGYAFVQFTNANEADQACLKLNQTQCFGARVDVHLAMLGTTKKTSNENEQSAPASAIEVSQQPIQGVLPVNQKNKSAATEDSTSARDLNATGAIDTMICGSCRFVTENYDKWREHKIAGCQRKREANEPEHKLRCSSCKKKFLSSWGLLEHLTDFHRMMLYTEVPKEKKAAEPEESEAPNESEAPEAGVERTGNEEPPAKKPLLESSENAEGEQPVEEEAQ